MTKTYLRKILDKLSVKPQRQLVIQINTNSYQNGMRKARLLVEDLEQQMRIQRLEIAVKNMKISRSLL